MLRSAKVSDPGIKNKRDEVLGCKLVQPLRKTVCRFLVKLQIELPYDLAMPFLGIYTEETIT